LLLPQSPAYHWGLPTKGRGSQVQGTGVPYDGPADQQVVYSIGLALACTVITWSFGHSK
jgi:hypothetical protein